MLFNSPLMQAIERHTTGKVLLSDGEDIQLDKASLCAEINTLALALHALDTHGIALAMDNSPQWVLADLAALECGIWTLPLPPFFTQAQCHNALQRSGCNTLLSDHPPTEGRTIRELVVLGKTLYVVALSSQSFPDFTQATTAKVTFTSGSTGEPKGLCLSSDQLLRTAEAVAAQSQALSLQRHVSLLPLAVLLENVAGVYAALLAGICCIVPSLTKTGVAGPSITIGIQLANYLQQQNASSCIMVPELLKSLTHALELHPTLGLEAMRFIAVGGATVGTTLLQRSHAQGLPVFEGYGLSEAGSVVCLNTPQAQKSGSAGRCLAHAALHVADDGEIWLDTAGFLGYCGEVPMSNSPFATGDIGLIDDEGFVFLHGRKKNTLITSMGRNIAPEWLESELTAHRDIAQAFVQLDPHSQSPEDSPASLSALIVSQANEETIEHCLRQSNARLPNYAQITQWARVPAFSCQQRTLTGNGKLKRHAISQRHRHIKRYTSL